MKKSTILAIPILIGFISACTPPYRLVYSPGFTFQNYDYVIVGKTDGGSSGASLYSMDVEIANLISRYNMKVIGDKEFELLTKEQKKQTLWARMSLVSSNKKDNLISISFDDAISGKTVASLTARAKGDMFDSSDRTEALENATKPLVQALERDKGLKITDTK